MTGLRLRLLLRLRVSLRLILRLRLDLLSSACCLSGHRGTIQRSHKQKILSVISTPPCLLYGRVRTVRHLDAPVRPLRQGFHCASSRRHRPSSRRHRASSAAWFPRRRDLNPAGIARVARVRNHLHGTGRSGDNGSKSRALHLISYTCLPHAPCRVDISPSNTLSHEPCAVASR